MICLILDFQQVVGPGPVPVMLAEKPLSRHPSNPFQGVHVIEVIGITARVFLYRESLA